ncbi:hypothetical protein COY32_01870 [candidate division WWE3 bacterium CG_4_10_14_0_2_um_filter_41_14]|uniref:Uncharacterized protein n=1 Tax=candidate division WWE3 bacterium CG_4_10_14_0_2_um_filter_41_14 TaxID=1975072 RepID=A0A2M7TKI9_UNCKA|nr:MAG: hypothetical protein COY32_01870 [candidate division WWE3 bacterium CG_4_10_14_0_2_um_filter_41_14]
MDEDEVECPHCHKFFLESMLSAHQATCTQAPANRIVFGVIHELSPSGWSFPQEVSDAENATQAWQMYADRFEIVPDFLYVVVSYLQGSIVQGAEPPRPCLRTCELARGWISCWSCNPLRKRPYRNLHIHTSGRGLGRTVFLNTINRSFLHLSN